MDQPVGLIGIGLLGSALADRMLRSGRSVLGFDLLPAARDAFARLGGEPALDAPAVAGRCTIIVLSLPDSQVVADLLHQLAPSLNRGTLILDTTTGRPVDAERRCGELEASGIQYVEATIAGSSTVVRAGQALTFLGGSPQPLARAQEVVESWSSRVFLVGPCGSASRMKLVVNLVLGLQRAVLAEGLAFARGQGLPLDLTLEILRAGPTSGAVIDAKGPKMVAGDFTAQARLSQHLKDVRLILDEAVLTGVAVPLSQLHRDLLEIAVREGWGDLDNSAVFRVYGDLA